MAEMEQLVAQFPKQLVEAIEIAKKSNLSLEETQYSNVVICGMGGSGIGGKLVSQWFAAESKVPFVLVQDYSIPAFVNGKTLFIASSYSGNTEETIAAVKAASKKGAKIVAVSSGGELSKFCVEHAYYSIIVPGGNPPRAMLAYSVVQLVAILSAAKIIGSSAIETIDSCRKFLLQELIQIKAKAKELAEFAHNKQLILYSNADQEAIAIRARQQFNENSKQLSWHHVIPEMNHNELVGWGGGNSSHAVVFFNSQFNSKRNSLRFKITKEVVDAKSSSLNIDGLGSNAIEESFYFIHLVDWASLYLAELNQKDPIDIKVIDHLKGELSKL